jgi:hypothetical protein
MRLHPSFSLLPLAVAAMLFAGCTSAEVHQSPGGAAASIPVSSVAVAFAPGTLPPDDIRWLKDNEVEQVLTQKIRERLNATGKLTTKGAVLNVKIVDMRLRSTGMTVMLGVMAGSDYMTAKVEVSQGGKILKSYDAEASRTSGAMVNPGSMGRAERMCEELADELVKQL